MAKEQNRTDTIPFVRTTVNKYVSPPYCTLAESYAAPGEWW